MTEGLPYDLIYLGGKGEDGQGKRTRVRLRKDAAKEDVESLIRSSGFIGYLRRRLLQSCGGRPWADSEVPCGAFERDVEGRTWMRARRKALDPDMLATATPKVPRFTARRAPAPPTQVETISARMPKEIRILTADGLLSDLQKQRLTLHSALHDTTRLMEELAPLHDYDYQV